MGFERTFLVLCSGCVTPFLKLRIFMKYTQDTQKRLILGQRKLYSFRKYHVDPWYYLVTFWWCIRGIFIQFRLHTNYAIFSDANWIHKFKKFEWKNLFLFLLRITLKSRKALRFKCKQVITFVKRHKSFDIHHLFLSEIKNEIFC